MKYYVGSTCYTLIAFHGDSSVGVSTKFKLDFSKEHLECIIKAAGFKPVRLLRDLPHPERGQVYKSTSSNSSVIVLRVDADNKTVTVSPDSDALELTVYPFEYLQDHFSLQVSDVSVDHKT